MFDNVMEDDNDPPKLESHEKIVCAYGAGNPKPNLFTGPISKVLSLLMHQQQEGVWPAVTPDNIGLVTVLSESDTAPNESVGPRGPCVRTTHDRPQDRRRVRGRRRGCTGCA